MPGSECPQQIDEAVCRPAAGVESVRDLAAIVGRQEWMLASLAVVRSREAAVENPQLVHVVDRAHQRPRRQFQHHRPLRDIEQKPSVRRL